MIFSQIVLASMIALYSAAPISVSVSISTCGSYFTNLDYECQHAGLMGAKDPNMVCPQKGCELGFCCKYAVPQLTPPKPGQAPPLPVQQKTPPVPQKIPPLPVQQKTPPVPQKIPPLPVQQKAPPVPQKIPPLPVQQKTPPIPKPLRPKITSASSHCPSVDNCKITIKGKNFQKNCKIGIFDPKWKIKSALKIIPTDCSEGIAKNIKIPRGIARKYSEINVDVVSADFTDIWSDPVLVSLN